MARTALALAAAAALALDGCGGGSGAGEPGIGSGLVLHDPASRTSRGIRAGQGIPSDELLGLEIDRTVSPPSLHVASAGGAAILRVLP